MMSLSFELRLAWCFALVDRMHQRRWGSALEPPSLQGLCQLPLTVLELCSTTPKTSLTNLLEEPAVSCQPGVGLVEQASLSFP